MQYLVLIIGSLGLVARFSWRGSDLASRIATCCVTLFAVVATWSLFLGLISVKISEPLLVLMLPASVIMTVLLLRLDRNQNKEIETLSHTSRFTWVIPGVFLAIVTWVSLGGPEHRMPWLLLQWDATSNPGVAATTRLLPSLDFMPAVITGWELYPRGSHAAAGMFSAAGSWGLQTFAKSTLLGFYSLVWVIYGLLMLVVGNIALRIVRLFEASRTSEYISIVGAQSVFLTPFLTEHLLMMHSLSFLCSLLAVLQLGLVLIDRSLQRHQASRSFCILATLSTFVVVANSYPILLPLVLFLVVGFVISEKNWSWSVENSKPPTPAFIAILAGFMAISMTALISYQDRIAASASFLQGGQLFAVPFNWLVVAVSLSTATWLGILRLRKFHAAVAVVSFTLGAIAVPTTLWLIVGNFNRTFGVNYYPKKAEYVTLVALAPIAIGFLSVLVERIVRAIRQVNFPLRLVLVASLIFCVIQIDRGPKHFLLDSANRNSATKELLLTALREANKPGMSVVFTATNLNYSVNASLLSNYLDKGFWAEPNSQTRNFVLAQQLLGRKSNQPLSDLCSLVNSPTFGPGRIYDLDARSLLICPPSK